MSQSSFKPSSLVSLAAGLAGFSLLLAACSGSTTGSVSDGGNTSSDSGMQMSDSDMSDVGQSMSSDTTQVSSDTSQDTSQAQTIVITAKNFAFTPNVIHVKQGQKVVLQLTSTDGHHGFSIPSLGINVDLAEGETQTVDLPTDQAGTFSFRCSVPCGPGHMDMTGTIVIE